MICGVQTDTTIGAQTEAGVGKPRELIQQRSELTSQDWSTIELVIAVSAVWHSLTQ